MGTLYATKRILFLDKARFVRDQDDEAYHAYADNISAFIEAVRLNKRDQWIKNYFSDSYPTDILDSHVVNDIVTNYERRLEGTIYQCENCGCVKIQVQDKNLFASFAPETEDCQNIFARFKE